MDNKRSFYAILPAYVRYDNELSSTSKLFYAEITALCNEKGYCWATNSYFSTLFSISDRQVRNILKQLVDKSYIKVIIEKSTKRKIFVLDTPEKNFRGVGSLFPGSLEKNFHHNNKKNNKKEYMNEIKRFNELLDEADEEEFVPLFDYDWLNASDND